jgi:hypothetical protein
VNAQKKKIDVWLNYRCSSCDGVWKAPVIERRPDLKSAPRSSMLSHVTINRLSGGTPSARLRPYVIRIHTNVRMRVERSRIECGSGDAALA